MRSLHTSLLVLVTALHFPHTSDATSTPATPPDDERAHAVAALHARAGELASRGGGAPRLDLPEALARLDYDGYRRIRALPEAQILGDAGLPFRIEPIHLGSHYRTPVRLDLLSRDESDDGSRVVVPIPYDPKSFSMPDGIPGMEPESGFAGLRIQAAGPTPNDFREYLVFHGASYFRGVGRGHGFGSSARGLTIGTAAAEGEEFPAFTRFLIEEPLPTDLALNVHALLESDSVVGVYSFAVTPGAESVNEIDATLYPRRDLERVGIAPLTSMFLFEEGRGRRLDDFRSAVHDSDGLQMINGAGERIWRPLNAPRRLQVSAFQDESPRGFGLVQRNREFESYGDLEARYEKRPTAWIEPIGDWGEGSVILVEIPTDTEFNDNIVAFWRPREPLSAGATHRFRYRIRWTDDALDDAPLARVVSTREGKAMTAGKRIFVVDFAPAPDASKVLTPNELRIDASAAGATIEGRRVEALPAGHGVRVTLTFTVAEDVELAEFSLRLLGENDVPQSETWLTRWTR